MNFISQAPRTATLSGTACTGMRLGTPIQNICSIRRGFNIRFGSNRSNVCKLNISPTNFGAIGVEAYFNSACATSLMLHCRDRSHDPKFSFINLLAVLGSLISPQECGLQKAYMVGLFWFWALDGVAELMCFIR